jgi:MFS family permease
MSDSSTDGAQTPARRRGYVLAAGVLLVMMLGGTLPIPLYVLYDKQMGFGPLGVTVVFVAYVLGTLLVLVALGDLSDHAGRGKVLALAVLCAVMSSALFLPASGIGLLIVARIVSGMGSGIRDRNPSAAEPAFSGWLSQAGGSSRAPVRPLRRITKPLPALV